MHSLLDLHHVHCGVFAQNIRQKTAMIRGQMLYDYKGHPRIGRKEGQKLLKRLQTAC